jgi:hypothetical protein
MNDAPAQQIGGKVAPRPLPPREALHLDPRRLGLRVILPDSRGQLLELQLHLVEKPLADAETPAPASREAATRRSFSSALQRRRRCTDVITSIAVLLM